MIDTLNTDIKSNAPTSIVPDHLGQPCRASVDFFAPAPKEIGQLISADSTLDLNQNPKSVITRLVLSCVSGLVLLMIAYLLSLAADSTKTAIAYRWFGAVFCLIAFISVFAITRFKVVCTYVGAQGLSKYTLSKSRGATPSKHTLLFAKASELRSGVARRTQYAVPIQNVFAFQWYEATGKELFKIDGVFRALGQKMSLARHLYHFAGSAEAAWSRYFLAGAETQLRTKGAITFRIKGKGEARVGQGFVELHVGQSPERLATEDIARFQLYDGLFSITRKSEGALGGTKQFRLEYASVSNAAAFIDAMEKLVGIKLNDESNSK